MAEMASGGGGEPREEPFGQRRPGPEGIGDELDDEVDAALERIRRGEPQAPQRRAAISSRVQELANSEMESRAKPPQPAADEPDAEPELSWAYRQQLLLAMKHPSPLLAAGAVGAIVGAVLTLFLVFGALILTGAYQHEARKPDVKAPPEIEIARAAPAPAPAALPRSAEAGIGGSGSSTSGIAGAPRPRAEPKPSRMPAASSPSTGEDAEAAGDGSDPEMEKEFDTQYGARAREGKPTVFIPPAVPHLPETLSEAEILQVVLLHKPEILACVKEHGGAARPGEKRRLVMRWDIAPDGRTSDVAVATAGLERSAVGGCLAGEIATWRFPPHSAPQPPIRFPFTY